MIVESLQDGGLLDVGDVDSIHAVAQFSNSEEQRQALNLRGRVQR